MIRPPSYRAVFLQGAPCGTDGVHGSCRLGCEVPECLPAGCRSTRNAGTAGYVFHQSARSAVPPRGAGQAGAGAGTRGPASFFRGGGSTLEDWERELAGDVAGKRVLHLACSNGDEVLSWANLGAIAIGADISEVAIGKAARKAGDAGIVAEFHRADMFDLPPLTSSRPRRRTGSPRPSAGARRGSP
jgi:hypothetical protein